MIIAADTIKRYLKCPGTYEKVVASSINSFTIIMRFPDNSPIMNKWEKR
ncbi:MAG: hypothetical protein SVW57_01140 [Thermodesulfobacteriota bacterium]|nr:hypothetical protein [Thermodesulfobacteriota bacterium]